MSECKDCDNCAEKENCNIKKIKINEGSKIKKIIAIGSGKGGVGKSLVTSLIATKLNNDGYKVGIFDADITGPSIPKTFGIKERAIVNDSFILPSTTKKE